jgi:hypothetical protein
VGDRPLLFSRRRQQVFELNPTADLIWRGFADGRSAPEVARALEDVGATPEQAQAFVAEAARAWMSAGCLAPAEVLDLAQAEPTAVRRLTLDELSLEIAFHGEAPVEACDAVFSQFYGRAAGVASERLAVAGHAGLCFLLKDGEPLAAGPPGDLPAMLKAQITEAYVEAVDDGFLAHGALLARGRACLILSGAPGAGKTTLTVAMAAAGWSYGGDDIVRFDADGQVRGAPFAAAVKSGAWPLASRFAPQIEALPVAVRADGQQVRYWRPARLASRTPRPPTGIVLLSRRAGARAHLEEIHPLEALHALLESAYAARWRLDGEAIAALAARIEAAACVRLVYEDLPAALYALEALA